MIFYIINIMAENNFHEDLRTQMLKNADEYNSQNKEYNKEFLDLLKEIEVLSKKGIYTKDVSTLGLSKSYYFANKLSEMNFNVFVQDWYHDYSTIPGKSHSTRFIITWTNPNVQILYSRDWKIA